TKSFQPVGLEFPFAKFVLKAALHKADHSLYGQGIAWLPHPALAR
ncbi:hypothetical protein H703_00190, partial [Bartonella bacilliformis Ver075]